MSELPAFVSTQSSSVFLNHAQTHPHLFHRKGRVVVNRGPLIVNKDTGKEEFDQDTCFNGRVIDRVYPRGAFALLLLSFRLNYICFLHLKLTPASHLL